MSKKNLFVYDTEIIGNENPVFLICLKNLKTKEVFSFWEHKRGHINKLEAMIRNANNTFISFNGIKFDAPLISAAIFGYEADTIKKLATKIIEDRMMPWEVYSFGDYEPVQFDHIDLIDVAPDVMTSLKTYAGRMFYPSMVDLPFHHDKDLTLKEQKVLEQYCINDLGCTEALWNTLKEEMQLRYDLSAEHGIDLRSKSDAQIAEAILKKAAGVSGKASMPAMVEYKAPNFIRTNNSNLNELIDNIEEEMFKINYMNGAPVLPEWLAEDTFKINKGSYQVGIGGLHSTHDKRLSTEADETWLISDFDVASYYPSIMISCGYTPRLGPGKGELFMDAYREIYLKRMTAKEAGDKKVANSLKITLNGTFGKLGSNYCSFYSPDLLLGVTITGQLNLLCLIDEIEKVRSATVLSANTDGIMVRYKAADRDKVLAKINTNAKRTGFVYEETRYRRVAMKDVNNYIAITTDGKVKAKGLYATAGLMKNPTMPVCSMAAIKYLLDGTKPEVTIRKHKKFADFTAIRNVKGGGVQHLSWTMIDDWVEIEDRVWFSCTNGKKEKRKSRPQPYAHGVGGQPFGRVARWYMTTQDLPALTYVSNGNLVPKTEGAKLCMILPTTIPSDLDRDWYVRETYSILQDIGVLDEQRKAT